MTHLDYVSPRIIVWLIPLFIITILQIIFGKFGDYYYFPFIWFVLGTGSFFWAANFSGRPHPTANNTIIILRVYVIILYLTPLLPTLSGKESVSAYLLSLLWLIPFQSGIIFYLIKSSKANNFHRNSKISTSVDYVEEYSKIIDSRDTIIAFCNKSIQQNEINLALDALILYTKANSLHEIYQTIILLSSRFAFISKAFNEQQVSIEDLKIETTQISKLILQQVHKLP